MKAHTCGAMVSHISHYRWVHHGLIPPPDDVSVAVQGEASVVISRWAQTYPPHIVHDIAAVLDGEIVVAC